MKKQRGDIHQNVCSYPVLENNDPMLCVCECKTRTQTGEDNTRKSEKEGGKDRESKVGASTEICLFLQALTLYVNFPK